MRAHFLCLPVEQCRSVGPRCCCQGDKTYRRGAADTPPPHRQQNKLSVQLGDVKPSSPRERENLCLQKGGISKYRTGAKRRRYTWSILDVILYLTQSSPYAHGLVRGALHHWLTSTTALARRRKHSFLLIVHGYQDQDWNWNCARSYCGRCQRSATNEAP